jgi:hypothetical protein
LARDKNGERTREIFEIIDFYNSNKYGVDIVNEMIDQYSYDIVSRRWPLKTFNFLLDIASLNSFVLYKQHLQRSGQNINYDDSLHKKFLYNLANQLMNDQKSYMAANNQYYIYKAFKQASDILINIKKKFSGLLPTKVMKCKVGQHAVRDYHMLECEGCNATICEDHVMQKIYCISCAEKVRFQSDNVPNNDELEEPNAKRTKKIHKNNRF